MTNNEFVEKLYRRQPELEKICKHHNVFKPESDDVIQEFYLIILNLKNVDKYATNDEPNMFIMFAIIKNLIYQTRKKNQKYNFIQIESLYSKLELFYLYQIDDDEKIDKYEFLLKEIEKVDYWFDKTILKLYIEYRHTIRSLSKETKISAGTIQPIIHSFKNQIKKNYKNQKDDF